MPFRRAWMACAVVAVLTTSSPGAAERRISAPVSFSFETTEGTQMSLDVSPDGETLVFDLLGDLYAMPSAGGRATQLLAGPEWDWLPRFSPDGGSVAFVSDRAGVSNVWIADVRRGQLTQASYEQEHGLTSLIWSRDGRCVFARGWSAGPDSPIVTYMPVATARARTCRPRDEVVYVSRPGEGERHRIYAWRPLSGQSDVVTQGLRPVASPSGSMLAFLRDEEHGMALWVREMRSGQERRLADLGYRFLSAAWRLPIDNTGIALEAPSFAFSPDGHSIYIAVNGRPAKVDVATGDLEYIPFSARIEQRLTERVIPQRVIGNDPMRVRQLRWTSVSPDRRHAVFSALGKIWALDVDTGRSSRLTQSTDLEYAPAYSPTGEYLAYVTWTDAHAGHVMVRNLRTGQTHRLTQRASRYMNPTWSPDGHQIAFIDGWDGVDEQYRRYGSQSHLSIFTVAAQGGPSERVGDFGPINNAAAVRPYSPLTFTANGQRIFFSQRQIENGRACDALRSVPVAGGEAITHLCIGLAEAERFGIGRIDHFVVSPDATQIAIVSNMDVWTAPFAGDALSDNVSDVPIGARRVSARGACYVSWLGPDTLTWSFAYRVETWSTSMAEPRLLAEVDLRVPQAAPPGTLAFTHARIITMRGDEIIPNGTIVVSGNLITTVGPADGVTIPVSARIIDASGMTIIPGLIDVHAHHVRLSPEMTRQQEQELLAFLSYGVTTVFDPAVYSSTDVFSRAEFVQAGVTLGPRTFSTGAEIRNASGHMHYFHVESLRDALNIAERAQLSGALMLKSYALPRRQQRQWLAQAARQYGIGVTLEGAGELWLEETAIIDGYTAVEHLPYTTPLLNDVAELFGGDSGAHLTPTLIDTITGRSGRHYLAERAQYGASARARRFGLRPDLGELSVDPAAPYPDSAYVQFVTHNDLRNIVDAGGHVSVGYHGGPAGLGTHLEMWLLEMNGLTPMQALRAATSEGALKLGLDGEIGSLAPGMLADFVVLNSNPLNTLRSSIDSRYVVVNGALFEAETMRPLSD